MTCRSSETGARAEMVETTIDSTTEMQHNSRAKPQLIHTTEQCKVSNLKWPEAKIHTPRTAATIITLPCGMLQWPSNNSSSKAVRVKLILQAVDRHDSSVTCTVTMGL